MNNRKRTSGRNKYQQVTTIGISKETKLPVQPRTIVHIQPTKNKLSTMVSQMEIMERFVKNMRPPRIKEFHGNLIWATGRGKEGLGTYVKARDGEIGYVKNYKLKRKAA